jgi:hypothetical protein
VKEKNTDIIAILSILAVVVSLIAALPVVKAQAPTLKTYPFVDANPNPVGVGDDVLIRTGIFQQAAAVGYGWEDLTVTVTDPDNKTTTLGPFDTDSTGSTFYVTVFDEAGTYKLQTHFPEQVNPVTFFNMEGGNMILNGTIMLASDSEVVELVVQEK